MNKKEAQKKYAKKIRLIDKYNKHYYTKSSPLVTDREYDEIKNDYEVVHLKRTGKIDEKSTVIDIGSGRGHHVNHYNNKGIQVQGLDNSPSMVKLAQQEYPNSKFKLGDALDSSNFQYDSASHILCLYFTIYSIEDKVKFFKNCYDWLQPGGRLVIHLVNRDKFDPILNSANPLCFKTKARTPTPSIVLN